MDFPDFDILRACSEVERRQREILPLLASAVGVPAEAVFYTWAFRRCRQSGEIPGGPWRHFFHGMECNLMNSADGRFLRLDFGPRGRIDTMSAWGVLQFIMTSVSPWADYVALKQLFADRGPPYDQHSGNFSKFLEHWDRLEEQGCFEVADPALVALQARYTSTDPSGIEIIEFPPGTPEETWINCSVAHRKHLSEHARQLLKAATPTTSREGR